MVAKSKVFERGYKRGKLDKKLGHRSKLAERGHENSQFKKPSKGYSRGYKAGRAGKWLLTKSKLPIIIITIYTY